MTKRSRNTYRNVKKREGREKKTDKQTKEKKRQ